MIILRLWPRSIPNITNHRANRRDLAYITAGLTPDEPKNGVTAVLLLHHGEPKTADEALKYRVERSISFYALPPFLKESLLNSSHKTNARKRLESYFKTTTHFEQVHRKQCASLELVLQKLLPELGPYKCYVGYLWTEPKISEVLDQMRKDSVSRLFVLPQYPHYWCFQSGLCVNELGKQLKLKTSPIDGRQSYLRHWIRTEVGPWDCAPRAVECSLIDRWPAHPALTETYCRLVENEVATLPYDVRHDVAILFCAPYPRLYDAAGYRREVASSCLRIAEALRHRYPYKIAWFNSWSQWSIPLSGLLTSGHYGLTKTLSSFAHAGRTNVVIVPLTYTSPSIDTEVILRSLCSNDVLRKTGIHHARFIRTPNDDPVFIHGLAEIVKNHYLSGSRTSSQFSIRCHRMEIPPYSAIPLDDHV